MPNVAKATPVPPSTVDYNSTVTYTCQVGYSHSAGDLTRRCNADGSLTGTTPVCTGKLRWQWWHRVIYISMCKMFRRYLGSIGGSF